MDALLRLKAPQRVARLRGRGLEEILGTEAKPEKPALAVSPVTSRPPAGEPAAEPPAPAGA